MCCVASASRTRSCPARTGSTWIAGPEVHAGRRTGGTEWCRRGRWGLGRRRNRVRPGCLPPSIDGGLAAWNSSSRHRTRPPASSPTAQSSARIGRQLPPHGAGRPNPAVISATVNAVANRFVEVAAALKRERLTSLTRILGVQLAQAQGAPGPDRGLPAGLPRSGVNVYSQGGCLGHPQHAVPARPHCSRDCST